MIDTVRFKIPLNDNIYNKIRRFSHETTKRNNLDGSVYFRVINDNIHLGSYDRKVNLFVYEESNLYLEFSLPKYLLGNNVYLLYVDYAQIVCEKLHKELVTRYGEFPAPNNWEIVRLDLCYAWKFQNNAVADTVLSILRSYKFPRKKLHTYDTSFMYVGTEYSIKFYLKQDEYYKHDFKELIKNPNLLDYAYEIMNVSDGVLRFEITYRDKAIKRYFPKDNSRIITIFDLDCDKIEANLGKMLDKFLKDATPEFMTPTEVIQQLLQHYNKTKAIQLYQFYVLYHSEDKSARDLLNECYSRITVYKNLKALAKAKIGLPRKDLNFDIDLSIPSDYVVNPKNAVSAVADQQRSK